MNPNMMARWFEDALVAVRFAYYYARADSLHPHVGFTSSGQRAPLKRRERASWAFNKSLGRI